MKLRLPSRLVHALLTTCGVALATSATLFADVPEDFFPVTISNVYQLGIYTDADHIAFLIEADIANQVYRMTGDSQYWMDNEYNTHILTFTNLESSSDGGAVSNIVFGAEGFKNILFSENQFSSSSTDSEWVGGGAIYSYGYDPEYHDFNVRLERNESVEFNRNTALHGSGGAILAVYNYVDLTGNTNVMFRENSAYYGGAISCLNSTIRLVDNESVIFQENFATGLTAWGGAIYCDYVLFSNNDSVIFQGNHASATSDGGACGGAIRAHGLGLEIIDNENVAFRGNYEQNGESGSATYRLRSVYLDGDNLNLIAGNDEKIVFYDTLYAEHSTSYSHTTLAVNYNADYWDDDDNKMHKATGDIVFSGKYAEEDLRELKSDYTIKELVDSLTTEVYAVTNLHGGRLSIEDGAIYKGNGINVAAGSNAVLHLVNGKLNHVGYDITIGAGATFALEGENSVMAGRMAMADGSTLAVNLGKANATTSLLTLSAEWAQEGHLSIDVTYDATAANTSPLRILDTFKDGVPTGWNAENISVSGTTFDKLQWSDGILYLNLSGAELPTLRALEWAGGDMIWNKASFNWQANGETAAFMDGCKVLFGTNGAGEMILDGTLIPRYVLVDNDNEHNYVWSGGGHLTGGMQLEKNGEGSLVIGTYNDYIGGTVLNGGTLEAGSSAAFGSGGIQINGGVLDLGGYAIANEITFAEGVDAIIQNGFLNMELTIKEGSLVADDIHIETSALHIDKAREIAFLNADCAIKCVSSGVIEINDTYSVSFNGNSATYGGAIYGLPSSSITLSNNETVTFSGNSATYGGAINGTITLSNNRSVTFSENSAVSPGTSSYHDCGGGAIYGAITLCNNESVTFSGNSSSYSGGAIDGTITLSNNKSVTFSGNSASFGGAIYGSYISSPITLSNNEAVTFSENTAKFGGGAIYGTLNIENNNSVTFSGNSAFGATYSGYGGGAIYGSGSSVVITFSGNDTVTFSGNSSTNGGAIYGTSSSSIAISDNDTVAFSGNSATYNGGAIYGTSLSTITLSGNNTVVFSGNSSAFGATYSDYGGGAIYGSGSSSITLSNNEAVTFSDNSALNGGAIYGYYSGTITLSGNNTVVFSGNSAVGRTYGGYGGAIYVDDGFTFNLTNNTSVEFNGNSATYNGGAIRVDKKSAFNLTNNTSVIFSGNSASSSGGAIFVNGTLNIAGNGHVEFRGNYEQSSTGNNTHLRSVYMYNGTLKLAAGEEQDITFYDTLYVGSGATVSFNNGYTDAYGDTQKATGDIVFSGKFAKEDLEKLKTNPSTYELSNSMTTEVLTTTNLCSGRLRIEDGAIYKGYGINVAEDSYATLRMANGTLNHAGYNVTLTAGTTLDLQGANMISTATLDMQDGSILSFTLGETNLTKAALTLDGIFNQGGNLTISIQGDETYYAEDTHMLISMASGAMPETWDIDKITLSGADTNVNHLWWENGVLYYRALTPLVTATWSGEQSRVWNFTDKNWKQGSDLYRYKDGVDVVFGDTGSGEVVLADEVTPFSVLVENSAGHDYSVSGEGSLAGATALTKEGAGKLTIATANTYEGGTVINGGTVVLATSTALGTGDIQLNDGVLDLGGNTIANNIITPEDAIVTIGNGTTTGNLSLAYTELTITGNVQVDGVIQADLENMIIVDDGATLGISQAIINTGDYLDISGSIDISKMHGEVIGISLTGGENPANGFLGTTERVQVIDNVSGGEVYIDYANFYHMGMETQLDDNFMAEVVCSADYTVFYLNEDAEKLSQALKVAHAAGVELATVEMKSGTQLNVDSNANADLIHVESGTVTMNIAQGATLSETDTTRTDFVLQGEGRYSLMSGSTTLGATMGDAWQGIVQINGATFSALDLDDYGTEDSTVSLNGVSAKLVNRSSADADKRTKFLTNLELLGDGLTLTDFTTSGLTYEFKGSVSGDGNMTFAPTGMRQRPTFMFTGDVSQWTGTYDNNKANRNSTLQFSGNATEMGAAIKQTAGAVTVVVGDGTEKHSTTFANKVEATDFTVSEQATAVLASDTAVTGKMTVLGSLKVEDGGNLALAQDATVSVGDSYTITGKGGTAPVLSGNMEIREAGFYGAEDHSARIDNAIVDLQAEASVVFDNVILGATSRLTDDPATVVANNMVIEGQYGVNVEEGAPMTIKSGSIMQRLGQPSELIELDSDATACRLDITNVDNVSITGNCLTIDLSGMYPALYEYSRKYDWLGISLGSGDQVAMLDTNMVVELKLNDRLHPRAYYLSSVGWGGADFIMPVANGENVGMIYINMFDVPEPTTSTFSLLALAALAARRRRK